MQKFVSDCMVTVGTNLEYALQVADLLIAADSRGHYRLNFKICFKGYVF